jgi:hypothetical protein
VHDYDCGGLGRFPFGKLRAGSRIRGLLRLFASSPGEKAGLGTVLEELAPGARMATMLRVDSVDHPTEGKRR